MNPFSSSSTLSLSGLEPPYIHVVANLIWDLIQISIIVTYCLDSVSHRDYSYILAI